MDEDGKEVKRLTTDNFSDESPKVSIQNKLIFSKRINDDVFKIFTSNIDGSNVAQLVLNPSDPGDWSPDGTQIVYTDARIVNGRLWIMNADGTNAKQLTFVTSF